MRLAVSFLLACISLTAQQANPEFHADVVALIEIQGMKQKLESSFRSMVESGKAEMIKRTPSCTPAFADEWSKRMLALMKAEDFIKVVSDAYEKHLNDADVKALTAFQRAAAQNKQERLPPELKQKLEANLPAIQSEIMGGSVQIGSKLGGEIGMEVGKEHPEYCKEK